MRNKVYGKYKIKWPLTDKYAEWTEKEIKDVESLEYNDGEWGGFEMKRNFGDKNPISNFDDDSLVSTPGNLFYDPTRLGTMTIVLYDVSGGGRMEHGQYRSGPHYVNRIEMRMSKVNNGKADGYIMFADLENDTDDGSEKESKTIGFKSWNDVLKALNLAKKQIKQDVWDIKTILGESVDLNESYIEYDTLKNMPTYEQFVIENKN
jgi:hypothetical protein